MEYSHTSHSVHTLTGPEDSPLPNLKVILIYSGKYLELLKYYDDFRIYLKLLLIAKSVRIIVLRAHLILSDINFISFMNVLQPDGCSYAIQIYSLIYYLKFTINSLKKTPLPVTQSNSKNLCCYPAPHLKG